LRSFRLASNAFTSPSRLRPTAISYIRATERFGAFFFGRPGLRRRTAAPVTPDVTPLSVKGGQLQPEALVIPSGPFGTGCAGRSNMRFRVVLVEDYDALAARATAGNPLALLRDWLARGGLQCSRMRPVDTAGRHLLVAMAEYERDEAAA
jgi:hypothetical protein